MLDNLGYKLITKANLTCTNPKTKSSNLTIGHMPPQTVAFPPFLYSSWDH